MIGFYDYTVIMTYISVVSSMIGIFCAVTDHISAAVCCLAFSGLCDMFDGKIARTKNNRTEEEKCFGIQIDSLADNARPRICRSGILSPLNKRSANAKLPPLMPKRCSP